MFQLEHLSKTSTFFVLCFVPKRRHKPDLCSYNTDIYMNGRQEVDSQSLINALQQSDWSVCSPMQCHVVESHPLVVLVCYLNDRNNSYMITTRTRESCLVSVSKVGLQIYILNHIITSPPPTVIDFPVFIWPSFGD